MYGVHVATRPVREKVHGQVMVKDLPERANGCDVCALWNRSKVGQHEKTAWPQIRQERRQNLWHRLLAEGVEKEVSHDSIICFVYGLNTCVTQMKLNVPFRFAAMQSPACTAQHGGRRIQNVAPNPTADRLETLRGRACAHKERGVFSRNVRNPPAFASADGTTRIQGRQTIVHCGQDSPVGIGLRPGRGGESAFHVDEDRPSIAYPPEAVAGGQL